MKHCNCSRSVAEVEFTQLVRVRAAQDGIVHERLSQQINRYSISVIMRRAD